MMPKKKKYGKSYEDVTDAGEGSSFNRSPAPKKEYDVLCPIHRKKIKVKFEDTREVAYCTCDVPDNKYKGYPVWEKPTKRRVV